MQHRLGPLPLLGMSLFLLLTHFVGDRKASQFSDAISAVVLPAEAQVFLFGGDRFLAADIEYVRAAMSGGTMRPDEASFRLRAHLVVSQLNPCHEDNYWVGNAELTWGGGQDDSNVLLRRAIACRTWEEWPSFYYGFNQYFFKKNIDEAVRAFELAAQRTNDQKNATSFRTIAVMLKAGQIDDIRMAIELLKEEKRKAKDPKFIASLDKRIERLNGLLILRNASIAYAKKLGRPLTNPQDLLREKIIDRFPVDPLGIGYELLDGEFKLRYLKNEGLEQLRRGE